MDEMMNAGTPTAEESTQTPTEPQVEAGTPTANGGEDDFLAGLLEGLGEIPTSEADEGEAETGDAEDAEADEDGTDEGETPTQTEEPQKPTEGEKDKAEPQTFKLTHLGKDYTVTQEQLLGLAQKGMNYDHVNKQKADYKNQFDGLNAFLVEQAQAYNMSPAEYVHNLRVQRVAGDIARDYQSKGKQIDRDVAIDMARRSIQSTPKAQQGNAEARAREVEQRAKAKTEQDVKTAMGLMQEYGLKEVPAEVLQAIRGQKPVREAFVDYRMNQLALENSQLKQNEKNAKKAVPQRKNESKANLKSDPFLSGLMEGLK